MITKKGKIAQIVWYVLTIICLLHITIDFLQGKSSTFATVGMFSCYATWILNLFLRIYFDYKRYKDISDKFEQLKAIHKARYRTYLVGDKERIKQLTEAIEIYGNALLEYGKVSISSKLLSKKHSRDVEEMLNQTEKLLTSIT